MRWQRCRRSHHVLRAIFAAAGVLLLVTCGTVQGRHTVTQDCRGGKVWHEDESARFQGCTMVQGTLELGGALVSTADFSSLRELRGSLVIGPSYQLDNLADLAALRRVSGDVLVHGNMQLSGVYLGTLEEIRGSLRVQNNRALGTVSMHRLQRVGGRLQVQDNTALLRLDLIGLREVEGDAMIGGKRLVELRIPQAIAREKDL